MKFYGIQKTSLIDYPGKIATTLFTYGCNFRCPFCQNPELVIKSAGHLAALDESEVIDFLNSRKDKIDAVVVTGGEPLLHNDLDHFLQQIRPLDLLIKIDTNGSLPERIRQLTVAKLVDYWAMDIKNALNLYSKTTGSKIIIANITKSIGLIRNSGVEYEFRTTVVPRLHDDDSMHQIGEMLSGVKKFYLQNFRNGKTIDSDFQNVAEFTELELNGFKAILEKYIENVVVRGL